MKITRYLSSEYAKMKLARKEKAEKRKRLLQKQKESMRVAKILYEKAVDYNYEPVEKEDGPDDDSYEALFKKYAEELGMLPTTREQIPAEYLSILDRYGVTDRFMANLGTTRFPIEAKSFLHYLSINMGIFMITNEGAFFWYAVAKQDDALVERYKKIEELKKIDPELDKAIQHYFIAKDMQITLKLRQKCDGQNYDDRILYFIDLQDQYELVFRKFVLEGKITQDELRLIVH